LSKQLAASGASPEEVDGAKHLFDPNALTLGFARRFATYKRPNLLQTACPTCAQFDRKREIDRSYVISK